MSFSYNGWVASESPGEIGVTPLRVAGVPFPNGVRSGDVATVLGYVAAQFHARVEPLMLPGCWGYSYRKNRNADNLSCHSSGTAIDCNAPRHPNGKRGTFTGPQIDQIRAILAEVAPVVDWGGDFDGTPDEMHFEINGSAAQVAAVATRLRSGGTGKDWLVGAKEDLTAEIRAMREQVSNKIDLLVTEFRRDFDRLQEQLDALKKAGS